MLKHISRFDQERFAWLLPLEIHLLIADYCKTGIEPAHFCYAETLPVSPDVRNVDFQLNGQLMLATEKGWRGLKFDREILATMEDCKGYYVIRVLDYVIVVKPDFTLHSKRALQLRDIALFHHCQKVVYVDQDGDVFELKYRAWKQKWKHEDSGIFMLTCQRSGNIVTVTTHGVCLVSPEYKLLQQIYELDVQWLGTDVWDQIVVAKYTHFSVYSADGKDKIFSYNYPYTHGGWITCSGAINMVDGTLCFLDTSAHHLVVYKNKYKA